MEKSNKIFKCIFIIAVILIPICVVIMIYFSFMGRTYLNINKKNEQEIMELLENEKIQTSGKLKTIGKKQGLGDWILYLKYYDGNKDEEVLNDGEARELYTYIGENGYCGGIKGKIVNVLLQLSIGIILLYILYLYI